MSEKESITLTDKQIETLKRLGVNLAGKKLAVRILAGRLPVIGEDKEIDYLGKRGQRPVADQWCNSCC